MPKYYAKTEKMNETKIHTVYEVDGDVSIAVWEGRNSAEAKKYAAECQRVADKVA